MSENLIILLGINFKTQKTEYYRFTGENPLTRALAVKEGFENSPGWEDWVWQILD
jgi:hypothetical protein